MTRRATLGCVGQKCVRPPQSFLTGTPMVPAISLISDEELEKKKEGQIPLNTKHNTAWAVRARKEWANERNNKAPVKHDKVREGFNIKQGRAGR